MALTAHTLYAVNVDAIDSANDVLIDQVSDFTADPGIQEALLSADGQVDPTFVAVAQQAPRFSFTTSGLATVLAKCGISGLDFTGDADDAGLECWFQKMEEGGTRVSGSNHLKMTAIHGLLLPRTITASDGEPASMAMEAVVTYNGDDAPIVIATSQALSGSPSVSEVFTAGPMKINGVTYDGVQSVTIDFGLQEQVLSSDGLVYPTFVCIGQRRPSITIQTTDVTLLNTFGLNGVVQGATDSVVYLRKMSEGATRVTDVTAEHISFTIDEGRINPLPWSAEQGGPGSLELRITPTDDGTNDIIAIDTTAAIT